MPSKTSSTVELEEFCAKHQCCKLRVLYGGGKWGWECPACQDEDREAIRQKFRDYGIERPRWWP